jgi:hypothetical protein
MRPSISAEIQATPPGQAWSSARGPRSSAHISEVQRQLNALQSELVLLQAAPEWQVRSGTPMMQGVKSRANIESDLRNQLEELQAELQSLTSHHAQQSDQLAADRSRHEALRAVAANPVAQQAIQAAWQSAPPMPGPRDSGPWPQYSSSNPRVHRVGKAARPVSPPVGPLDSRGPAPSPWGKVESQWSGNFFVGKPTLSEPAPGVQEIAKISTSGSRKPAHLEVGRSTTEPGAGSSQHERRPLGRFTFDDLQKQKLMEKEAEMELEAQKAEARTAEARAAFADLQKRALQKREEELERSADEATEAKVAEAKSAEAEATDVGATAKPDHTVEDDQTTSPEPYPELASREKADPASSAQSTEARKGPTCAELQMSGLEKRLAFEEQRRQSGDRRKVDEPTANPKEATPSDPPLGQPTPLVADVQAQVGASPPPPEPVGLVPDQPMEAVLRPSDVVEALTGFASANGVWIPQGLRGVIVKFDGEGDALVEWSHPDGLQEEQWVSKFGLSCLRKARQLNEERQVVKAQQRSVGDEVQKRTEEKEENDSFGVQHSFAATLQSVLPVLTGPPRATDVLSRLCNTWEKTELERQQQSEDTLGRLMAELSQIREDMAALHILQDELDEERRMRQYAERELHRHEDERQALMAELDQAKEQEAAWTKLKEEKEKLLICECKKVQDLQTEVDKLLRRAQANDDALRENSHLKRKLHNLGSPWSGSWNTKTPSDVHYSTQEIGASVAKMECAGIMELPLAERHKFLKKLRVKWHPDTQPSQKHVALAEQVMKELHNRPEFRDADKVRDKESVS